MSKPEYHVASFSGGKDSTAVVLHMIERGDHLAGEVSVEDILHEREGATEQLTLFNRED